MKQRFAVLIHPQPLSPLLNCWALLEHPQINFFSWPIHEYFATLFRSSTQLNNSLTICQQLSKLTSTPFKCSNTYNSRASQRLYHHSCHIHWNPFYFKYIPWNLDTSCLMLLHFISKLHDILSTTTQGLFRFQSSWILTLKVLSLISYLQFCLSDFRHVHNTIIL